MTDNDIIKALECEIRRAEYVDTEYLDCVEVKDFKLALDLINRQKAEMEQLRHNYALAVAEREANVKGFTEQLSKVRAEAITEFAERLKNYYNKLDKSRGILISFHIDQIAKEMKGVVNNEG